MAEFTLAHVGINAGNMEEARNAAEMFQLIFGMPVHPGNHSVFAGDGIEIMDGANKGTHGHIGIGTPNVAAAQAELERRGFEFDPSSKKFRADGVLNVIYLKDEICGFAVHLVGNGE